MPEVPSNPERPATLELPPMDPRATPPPEGPIRVDPGDHLDMYERGWCPYGDVMPGYVGQRHAISQNYGNGVNILADGGSIPGEQHNDRRRFYGAIAIAATIIIVVVICVAVEITTGEKTTQGSIHGILTTGYCKSDANYENDAGGFCQDWVNGTDSLRH